MPSIRRSRSSRSSSISSNASSNISNASNASNSSTLSTDSGPIEKVMQSVHYRGIDYDVKILELVEKGREKYGLISCAPYYERAKYLVTEGVVIPKKNDFDPKYKTIMQYEQRARNKKRNNKYYFQCPYCEYVISKRKDVALRHMNKRSDHGTICSERLKAEPDTSIPARRPPIRIDYDHPEPEAPAPLPTS